MNKKLVLILCIVLAVLLLIALVIFRSSVRKITVISGSQNVHKCPRYARPGQTVTVETAVVADADLYVNGVDGKFVRPGEFVFTMPNQDVNLKVTVIANGRA